MSPAQGARQEEAILARAQLPEDRERRHLAPLGLVAIAIGFNLWVLRAEILPVLNQNDSAVHLSMVRWAFDRMREGHLPLDGWYPYLGLGSPLFHHYQSLPHILTGILALAIGPDRAFSGTLYFLLALFPISVYAGARLLGWERWVAAGAALISPLLVSTPAMASRSAATPGKAWGCGRSCGRCGSCRSRVDVPGVRSAEEGSPADTRWRPSYSASRPHCTS